MTAIEGNFCWQMYTFGMRASASRRRPYEKLRKRSFMYKQVKVRSEEHKFVSTLRFGIESRTEQRHCKLT